MAKVISKEQLDYVVDLLVTMVVEEISNKAGKDSKEVLPDFLCSKTGKALYDTDNKLWWNGPLYIAEMYFKEKENNKCTANEGFTE